MRKGGLNVMRAGSSEKLCHPAAGGVGGEPYCPIGGGPVIAACDMHDVAPMQTGPMWSRQLDRNAMDSCTEDSGYGRF